MAERKASTAQAGRGWKDIVLFFIPASIGSFPAQVLLTWGTRLSRASKAALLMLTLPVCAAVLTVLLLGEKLTIIRWISIGLGILGILYGVHSTELFQKQDDEINRRRFMRNRFVAISVLALAFATHALLLRRDVLAIESQEQPVKDVWSIGIYTGVSPFKLSEPGNVKNPVLTPEDVTDFSVNIVAHPFMVIEGSRYYLFFTAKNDQAGEVSGIGLAESSNGTEWKYSRIVLKEPFVLSYPYVFKYRDSFYMIPEAYTEKFVRLYRATEFPYKWIYEKDLLTGDNFISASVVEFAGMWWMFVGRLGNETLRLFYANDLMAQWKEHPLSPVVAKDPNIARPGGRALVIDGKLYRIGQDCEPTYGSRALAFEVTDISPAIYKEATTGIPLVGATSKGWNADAMHHVDLHQLGKDRWIAAVDGKGTLTRPAFAQPLYEIVLKGGHVLDSRNHINRVMDVAVADGKIAAVAESIPAGRAKRVINAAGLYVAPGLVDIHTHVFAGTTGPEYTGSLSVRPDGFSFRSGVTTMVDAGSAGWRNFAEFKKQIIDASQTRVLAFLNIVGKGMAGRETVEQDITDMDSERTAEEAVRYPGLIVGIKIAHYAGPDWMPVDRAVEAGRRANVPVMVDFAEFRKERPFQQLVLEHLRPGDIYTHLYLGAVPMLDANGTVLPYLFDARRRGVIFDVGHGAGSFLWRQAVPALRQGFAPDSISTDLHAHSMNAGMKDILNVMSKFLALGLSLEDVVARSTWNPAREIHQEDLGHLSVGAPADIAVLRLMKGEFGFLDARGTRLNGSQKLVAELTIRAGRVVWDLNGLAADDWQRAPARPKEH